MKNETIAPENQNDVLSTTETEQPSERKKYHTPTLLKYGGLAELVQIRTGRGMDGGGFPDCTLT